jgi:hypothetical protein
MRASLFCLAVVAGCSRGDDVPTAAPSGSSATLPSAPGAAPGKPASQPQVTFTPPADARAGHDAVATILVHPPDGYDINTRFPMEVEVTPTDGLEPAKTVLTRHDAEVELADDHLAVALHVTPAAGTHDLTGHMTFGYCGKGQCLQSRCRSR